MDYVDLTLSDAQAFADYSAISNDLDLAMKWAQQLLKDIESTPPELTTRAVLEIAILIKYFRAFGGGLRRSLGKVELQAFTATQLAAHEYLKECRDKHIAHPINAFEEAYARVVFADGKIVGVGFAGAAKLIRKGDLRNIIELSQVLIGIVQGYIDREHDMLLQKLVGMSVKDIRAGGHAPGKWPVGEREQTVSMRRRSAPKQRP